MSLLQLCVDEAYVAREEVSRGVLGHGDSDGAVRVEALFPRAAISSRPVPARRVAYREIAFIDPGVDHIGDLLRTLRDDVKAVVLNASTPVHVQMAAVLSGRRDLSCVHIVAHGEPGRVHFSAGDWSLDMLDTVAGELAVIGQALASGGDLRLWSCLAGAGPDGQDFIRGLSARVQADVAAADTLVGASELGGSWALGTGGAMRCPPLTPEGQSAYQAVLSAELTVTGKLPVGPTTKTMTFYIVETGRNAIVGQVLLPDASPTGSAVDMKVRVPSAEGTFAIGAMDPNGGFQAASFLTVNGALGATGARGH